MTDHLRDTLKEQYLVIHAPGWPGGYEPWPNTLEHSRKFVRDHGGELRVRLVSDWETVGVSTYAGTGG